MVNLQRKINKYTNKLKKAKNIKEAEIYQDKLRNYHRLNQMGGQDLALLEKELDSKKNQLILNLGKIKTFNLTNLDKLEKNLLETQQLLSNLKAANLYNQSAVQKYKDFTNEISLNVEDAVKNLPQTDAYNKQLDNIVATSDSIVSELNLKALGIDEKALEQEFGNANLSNITSQTSFTDLNNILQRLTPKQVTVADQASLTQVGRSIKNNLLLTDAQRQTALAQLEKIYNVTFTS